MQTINNVEVKKENSRQVQEVEWARFWTVYIMNDAGNSDLRLLWSQERKSCSMNLCMSEYTFFDAVVLA